ncbi:MAG TPA: FAD-binding oxidoreductase [Steroidobacteraceae bacterium]|nr:FAD-binding oxidoreductase [Steroidobacteraceae bacterium]
MQRRDFCKSAAIGGALAALPAPLMRAFATEPAAAAGAELQAVTLSGKPTVIPAAAVKDFAANFHGKLLSASDAEYDQARRLWNKMIDRRPALIARCSGAADIASAVSFARERELLVAVRGGGHSFPGYSMCEGGLVIDLSMMRGVRVDPIARTAQVAGGSWIGDLDWEAQQFGLATTMGEISNTGVAGLTLGGGYGWLARRHGLACDNLLAVDLITADGKLLRVSKSDNPDLFWAIRGGGGNFGVVSSFEYRLHQVGPKVLAGDLAYAPAQTRDALEQYAHFAARAPRELSGEFSWGGAEGPDGDLTLSLCYSGDPKDGEKALQPLRTGVKARADSIRLQDYVAVQRQYDGPPLSSQNQYLKGGYVAELTPAFFEALINEVRPNALLSIVLEHCGGTISDVAPNATAIAHRSEQFQLLVAASWKDAADNEANRARVHAAWDKISTFTNGFYVNLNTADQKAVDDNYGPNRARLSALKKEYDPANLFRLNANIRPST